MSLLSSRRKPAQAGYTSGAGPRVGQVYLDVQRRQLHFLTATARQLSNDGVPFLAADLARTRLLHFDGTPVGANELPLGVSWQEARPAEAAFVLPRPPGPPWHVSWHTAPIRDVEG